MFNKVTTGYVHTVSFVQKHKVAIAVTITATAMLALQNYNRRELNKFLKEHDLYDEYWTPAPEDM